MTANVLWVSDNPIGKQKLKDMKRNASADLDIYDFTDEKVSDIIKIIELADKLGRDPFEEYDKELA